jgi:hypothetical protein
MSKNFKVSEQEKKQILEMHGNHGYRKPLNESPQLPPYYDRYPYNKSDNSTDIKTKDTPKDYYKDKSWIDERNPTIPSDITYQEIEDLLKEVEELLKSDLEQNGYTVKFDSGTGKEPPVVGEKNVLLNMRKNPEDMVNERLQLFYDVNNMREIVNIIGGITDKIRHRDNLRVMVLSGMLDKRIGNEVGVFNFVVRTTEYAEKKVYGKKIPDMKSDEMDRYLKRYGDYIKR